MKILLFGSTGYVGRHFWKKLNDSKIPYKIASGRGKSFEELRDMIWDSEATTVINCAGFTGKPNVDACEHQKGECIEGNVMFPTILAEICHDFETPLGHISSGCIYTGRRHDGKGFTEADAPNFTFKHNNCSFYSGTKAQAEEILTKHYPYTYIWRLRIPYNNDFTNPRNYLSKLLNYSRLLDAENSISHLEEFVDACIHCVSEEVPYGIYNITNPGYVTTKWVTEQMEKILPKEVLPKKFDFFQNDEEFYKTAANTPRSNCVLDSSKILSVGTKLTPVEDSVIDALKDAHLR